MKTMGLTLLAALALGLAAVEAEACAGCGCAAPPPKKATVKAATGHDHHGYTTVDTEGLKKMLASGEDIVLVDARAGKWDDGRRIAHAKQLGAQASKNEIAAALPDKGAKIVAYCTSTTCPASATLAHRLADLGYKNVVKYPGGIEGWVKAGNKATK